MENVRVKSKEILMVKFIKHITILCKELYKWNKEQVGRNKSNLLSVFARAMGHFSFSFFSILSFFSNFSIRSIYYIYFCNHILNF